jgi:hypothetical protein
VKGNKEEAFAGLDMIRARMAKKNHYLILIEYLAEDAFSENEGRARHARSVLMDSIDQYCLNLITRKQPV